MWYVYSIEAKTDHMAGYVNATLLVFDRTSSHKIMQNSVYLNNSI